jgi:hypothetical protein
MIRFWWFIYWYGAELQDLAFPHLPQHDWPVTPGRPRVCRRKGCGLFYAEWAGGPCYGKVKK